MREEPRGSLYLLTGLIIGLALGLFYTWAVQPIDYQNTSPDTLAEEYKSNQRVLIALAYAEDRNFERARARLDLLKDPDIYTTLVNQAQRALTDGSSPQEARALSLLSVAMGEGAGPIVIPTVPTSTSSPTPGPTDELAATLTREPSPTVPTHTASLPAEGTPVQPAETMASTTQVAESNGTAQGSIPPASPTDTLISAPTFTPLPARNSTQTPGAPYILDEREQICESPLAIPLIEILVQNAAGEPVPGVEIVITWDSGEDHFFTGLKPELGLGYADFDLQEGETYNLRLVEGAQVITGLTAVECSGLGGDRFWGAWRLSFVQP